MLKRAAVFSVAANTMIFIVFLLGVYGLAEWAFPRLFTRVFPLEAISKFDEPDGMWPLLQSSKQGFLPQSPYIALVGDSYAMGMGDGMVAAYTERRAPFSSAHTVQALTERDVIAYGFPGSGSIRGMISNPVAGREYLQHLLSQALPDPAWMVVYFYEGNDLSENWLYFQHSFTDVYEGQDYRNAQVFENYVNDVALGRHHLYQAAQAVHAESRLLLWRYARRLFAETFLGKKFYRRKYPNEFGLIYVPEQRWVPRVTPASSNYAQVNGESILLPDNLQGPAMDLSDMQLAHALDTFDRTLTLSQHFFPQSRFVVVYIPSVLSTYHLLGEQVTAQNFFGDHNRYSRAALEQRQAMLRSSVGRIVTAQGLPFIDTSDALRQAASTQLLHGPHDWNHFNLTGYQLLGREVAKGLLPLLATGEAEHGEQR